MLVIGIVRARGIVELLPRQVKLAASQSPPSKQLRAFSLATRSEVRKFPTAHAPARGGSRSQAGLLHRASRSREISRQADPDRARDELYPGGAVVRAARRAYSRSCDAPWCAGRVALFRGSVGSLRRAVLKTGVILCRQPLRSYNRHFACHLDDNQTLFRNHSYPSGQSCEARPRRGANVHPLCHRAALPLPIFSGRVR